MFSSRKSKNLINKIRDWSLRIISGDKESDLQALLEKPNQLTIHQRNLQVLMIEVYKTLNSYTLSSMENLLLQY